LHDQRPPGRMVDIPRALVERCGCRNQKLGHRLLSSVRICALSLPANLIFDLRWVVRARTSMNSYGFDDSHYCEGFGN
jgi:hypothetical protein